MNDEIKPLSPRAALAASRRRMAGALDQIEKELGVEVRRPVWRDGVAVLLIDASSSMAGHKLGFAVQGATDFAETAIRSGMKVGVVAFSSEAVGLIEPSGDGGQVAAASRRCRAEGSTNLYAGLALAWQMLSAGSSPRRSIVLVTDGEPDDEGAALAIASQIKANGGEILTIGTEDANHAFLKLLASQAGFAQHVSPTQLAGTIKATAKLLGLGGPSK
jgi:Mg-chelatase subunit ChlD